MKKYERPMVYRIEQNTEGVYLASGSPDGGNVDYTLTRHYAGDSYNMYEQWYITFEGIPSGTISNASAVVQIDGTGVTSVSVSSDQQADVSLSGDQIYVTLHGYVTKVLFTVNCSSHSFTLR